MKATAHRAARIVALLAVAHGLANAQNAARWSWQEPQAKVLPTGDLEWTPTAFAFKPGKSVRYIDFDSGSDANDGLSKQTPWKHISTELTAQTYGRQPFRHSDD